MGGGAQRVPGPPVTRPPTALEPEELRRPALHVHFRSSFPDLEHRYCRSITVFREDRPEAFTGSVLFFKVCRQGCLECISRVYRPCRSLGFTERAHVTIPTLASGLDLRGEEVAGLQR